MPKYSFGTRGDGTVAVVTKRLQHVGFKPAEIEVLTSADFAVELAKVRHRRTFARPQRESLLAGHSTMADLLGKGKFTRRQAQVLIDLNIV